MKSASLISVLKTYQKDLGHVVPFDRGQDKLFAMDFSDANREITATILSNTPLFTSYINDQLKKHHARYGIGGYAEHRTIYAQSDVFNAPTSGEEPRRFHLGTDIWGKPHTPVMAPLDGLIHSFAFNNQFGDYGATIILSHMLNGVSFYTLYGHLSLSSIRNIAEGDKVNKGDVFAEFGIPADNGHWPPHLYFQLIADISGWKGDYPGVCKLSEKENWMTNCPDPDIILQLNQYL